MDYSKLMRILKFFLGTYTKPTYISSPPASDSNKKSAVTSRSYYKVKSTKSEPAADSYLNPNIQEAAVKPEITSADKTTENSCGSQKVIEFNFTDTSIIQAMVNTEIFGAPRAKRKRRCNQIDKSINR